MPKIGDVMFVRSTEEPTVFIAERPQDKDDNFPLHEGSGRVYVVRRPSGAPQSGIQTYKFFDFLAEELETQKESHERNIKSLKMRQELLLAEMSGDQVDLSQKPS